MAVLDWFAIVLLVVSMLFGLVRGLVFEVISLAGSASSHLRWLH